MKRKLGLDCSSRQNEVVFCARDIDVGGWSRAGGVCSKYFAEAIVQEEFAETAFANFPDFIMLKCASSRALARNFPKTSFAASVLPTFRSRNLATVADPLQKVRSFPPMPLRFY